MPRRRLVVAAVSSRKKAFKLPRGSPFSPCMSGPLGSALSAAASAVTGIRRAGEMHDRAADTVQLSFHGPESATPLQTSDGARSGQPAATVNLSSVSRDLGGAFTDMIKAEGLNKANVSVIKTVDEMTRELTDILA